MPIDIRDVTGGILGWMFLFWIGGIGFLLPLWILKRWIFDP